jgi:hypothetical protein
MLSALTNHPTLELLRLRPSCGAPGAGHNADDALIIGALGALVAADASALINLQLYTISLDDAGLLRLLLAAALEQNSHLRNLRAGSRAGGRRASIA